MDLRQLARQLQMDEAVVRRLAVELSGIRFRDGDRLSDEVVERITASARARNDADHLLREAYAGVKPLGPQPKKKPTGSRAEAPADRPPAGRPTPATLTGPAPVPRPVAGPAPTRPSAPGRAVDPLIELRTGERDQARREAERALAEVEAWRARAARAESERDEARAERDAARAELARRESRVVGPAEVFARRGLRGEDEIAMLLRAFVDSRREDQLLRSLRVEDEGALERLLEERVILLAEGEVAPPGTLVVRVPPARSESAQAPALRAAASKLSTLCLVRGWRRVLVVGARPAMAGRMREAVDPRIELTFSPEPRALPADLVLSFVDMPGALRVEGRSLAEVLQGAVAKLAG